MLKYFGLIFVTLHSTIMRLLLLSVLTFCFVSSGYSQDLTVNDSIITVKGKVLDTNATIAFYNIMVVNKTAGKGIFGDYTGNFEIIVKKGDLLAVSVVGYQTIYFSFKDHAYKPVYDVTLYLKLREVSSDVVEVTPLKTLEELQEERANIAKRETPKVTVENAFTSPITALYVAFSKREKTKRLVADMEYQDQQDDIVREILRIYVHNDIINLSEEDFTEFINFLNLNDEFLKKATDYELITYIKAKYEHFIRIKAGY